MPSSEKRRAPHDGSSSEMSVNLAREKSHKGLLVPWIGYYGALAHIEIKLTQTCVKLKYLLPEKWRNSCTERLLSTPFPLPTHQEQDTTEGQASKLFNTPCVQTSNLRTRVIPVSKCESRRAVHTDKLVHLCGSSL